MACEESTPNQPSRFLLDRQAERMTSRSSSGMTRRVLEADDGAPAVAYVAPMLAGLLLAALASLLFNAAIVLQATEARAVPADHGLRLSLLGRLLRRPRWVAGIVLSIAAVALQVLALTLAPLTVVQPADAAGLVLLLTVGSRV